MKMKENEIDRQIVGSCQRAQKAMEHEGDGDINFSWRPRKSLLGLRKETEGNKIRGRIDWFSFFVYWHLNLCWLFNAKAILLEQ